MGTNIKMYFSGSGGLESGLAQIDVPANGFIEGCLWAVEHDADADGDSVQVQLSFGSAASFTTNDSRQVISEVRAQYQITTSGGGAPGINLCHPCYVPVSAGERLYIHSNCTAGVVARGACLISFSFDLDGRAVRRR